MLNKILYKIDTARLNPLKYAGIMLSSPEVVIIEPTNHCNFSCQKCLRHHGQIGRQMGFLSLGDLETMLSKLPATIKFIGINGFGEPLAHPQFSEILRIIRRYDPVVGIGFHTNGTMLNEAVISACIECGVNDIEVSIDSHVDKDYQDLHTTGFKVVQLEEKLRMLVAAKRAAKSPMRIGLAYIMQKENRGSLPDFIAWAHGVGVDFVGPVKPVNPLLGYDMADWQDPQKDMEAEVAAARLAASRLGFEVQLPDLSELKPGSANISSIKHLACSFPWNLYPVITWDGNSLPCAWIQDGKYSCGNLISGSFFEIWNGRRIRAIRKAFASNKYLPACANCRPGNFKYCDMDIIK